MKNVNDLTDLFLSFFTVSVLDFGLRHADACSLLAGNSSARKEMVMVLEALNLS